MKLERASGRGGAALAGKEKNMKHIKEILNSGKVPVRKEGDLTVFDLTAAVGDRVFCDDCGIEYTDSEDPGGIAFGRSAGKAICGRCAPKWIALARKHGETHLIKALCPITKPFAQFVRELREARR